MGVLGAGVRKQAVTIVQKILRDLAVGIKPIPPAAKRPNLDVEITALPADARLGNKVVASIKTESIGGFVTERLTPLRGRLPTPEVQESTKLLTRECDAAANRFCGAIWPNRKSFLGLLLIGAHEKVNARFGHTSNISKHPLSLPVKASECDILPAFSKLEVKTNSQQQ